MAPCKSLSIGRRRLAAAGCKYEGWNEATRARIASQVDAIKHWRVIEGDYNEAPDIEATWFVDPPYNNKAGSYYIHSDIDYPELGKWCQGLRGQVVVCENDGATWLPFRHFRNIKAGPAKRVSAESIWTNT